MSDVQAVGMPQKPNKEQFSKTSFLLIILYLFALRDEANASNVREDDGEKEGGRGGARFPAGLGFT